MCHRTADPMLPAEQREQQGKCRGVPMAGVTDVWSLQQSGTSVTDVQVLRSLAGNQHCLDCDAFSRPVSSRTKLGQPEPWWTDLHRVLRHPSQPGHPHLQSEVPRPGCLAVSVTPSTTM
ncbi:hypothetical protein LAZ67_20002658 [Cordylochernes scorpioides]|uniref:Uncharacterized protein n=1 Tax=Cordylochernes scorpioides TaxID=51811 RepID=A0ABY6LKV7_9ARAC|nr:hypothetical protein LAZ67_20002658 [Cordylochernes scorpioides]